MSRVSAPAPVRRRHQWCDRLSGSLGERTRALRSRMAAGEESDAGQILLLTLAYALIALSLVLVIASASAVHIERKQLLALADAAALDAADAIDLELFYGSGDEAAGRRPDGVTALVVPLSNSGVRDAAAQHLAGAPSAAGLPGLAILEPTGTADGTTAQVTLGAVVRPPFIPWALVGWSDGIALRVTSSARAG